MPISRGETRAFQILRGKKFHINVSLYHVLCPLIYTATLHLYTVNLETVIFLRIYPGHDIQHLHDRIHVPV